MHTLLIITGIVMAASNASALPYDGAQVPDYSLPDPLQIPGGNPVSTLDAWESLVKPAWRSLFEQEMYGIIPAEGVRLTVDLAYENPNAIDGLAHLREVRLRLERNGKVQDVYMLVLTPKQSDRATPAFVGLNFAGNHTVVDDPGIRIPSGWVPNRRDLGIEDNRASSAHRGKMNRRWPVRQILSRGVSLVTAYSGDIDPDFDDGFTNGVHGLFSDRPRDRSSWGTLAAWAWGLSRMMDALEDHSWVDISRVAVIGHSRMGKAALLAGVIDSRFSLVISNQSGCGGAALSRRRFGERLKQINSNFPHWFCEAFHTYNARESELPFDQHIFVSLVAPRPVLIGSAEEDRWADPQGEFLSLYHANPVYRLYGLEGLPHGQFPTANGEVAGHNFYHIREGRHDLTEYDWVQYLSFAGSFWNEAD